MTMPFNVDTKIDINFTEEQITEILLDVVREKMSHVKVEGLEFRIQRQPTRVNADVRASLKGFHTAEMEPVEACQATEPAPKKEQTKAVPDDTDEPEEDTSGNEPEAATLGDIFGEE